MGKKSAWITNRFDGGWSVDDQVGVANSFAYSRHMDFRKKPSQMTVLPATRKESGTTVVDLVQNMVMVGDGVIYGLGSTGYVYKRTTAGVWSQVGKLDDGAFGMSYRPDVDKIYICSKKTVSELSPISGTATLKANKFASSVSTDTNATLTGGTNTATLGTTVVESATTIQEFSSDIEPLTKIQVKCVTPGTGNWTLTLHDAANNVLGTSTVANASVAAGLVDFTFTTPIRLYVKPNARTYHFHVTSTVADGTIQTTTASDVNTCDFNIYADRLIDTKNGMHPMQTFLQYECIGNGNYLSVREPLSETPLNSEWLRHKLVFPAGLEVCSSANWREYHVIGCERRTDSGNAQDGYMFFWDGLSSTYNYFLRIPEGAPYSMHEHKDVLYYEAGGAEFAYSGGQPVKLRTFPNTDSEYSDTDDTTITYPYMSTVRRGVHILGFPSQTTNTSIEHGAYSYGAVDDNFKSSFGYSYSISTGTRLNTSGDLKIGMIKNFGDKMFISWQDGANYGVDVVDNSSDPFAATEWRSWVFDEPIPTKDKQADYMEISFDTLPAGVSITPKYRTSGSGSWTTDGTVATSGDSIKMSINKRFKQIQLGFDIAITGTETPTITGVTLVYDSLLGESL